jgi:GR25 family glycosyltransferase involved in LPS biosynthesis
MENIKCFCINLKNRKDRWDNFSKKIMPLFNNVERFEAINGKELDKTILDDILSIRSKYNLGKDRRDHNGIYTYGAIGCYLSHVNLWTKIVEENINECIIFEDDVIINKYIDKSTIINKISEIIKESKNICRNLNKELSYIFLSYNAESYDELSPNVIKLNDSYGTIAYYITNYGAKKLLKNVYPIEVQIDSYIFMLSNVDKDLLLLAPSTKIFNQSNLFETDIQTKYVGCDKTINVGLIIILLIIIFSMIIAVNYKKLFR